MGVFVFLVFSLSPLELARFGGRGGRECLVASSKAPEN